VEPLILPAAREIFSIFLSHQEILKIQNAAPFQVIDYAGVVYGRVVAQESRREMERLCH